MKLTLNTVRYVWQRCVVHKGWESSLMQGVCRALQRPDLLLHSLSPHTITQGIEGSHNQHLNTRQSVSYSVYN